MADEQTLKPCPFCGSETAPAVVSIMEIEWRVCCKSIHFGCGAYIAFHDSEQEAIAAWNKRADQAQELAALRAFAKAVMDCWPDGWGIEGDDLQRIATEHGMLRPEIRHDPCGDGCRCADHALPNEWTDGVVCYRKTALLTGAEQ